MQEFLFAWIIKRSVQVSTLVRWYSVMFMIKTHTFTKHESYAKFMQTKLMWNTYMPKKKRMKLMHTFNAFLHVYKWCKQSLFNIINRTVLMTELVHFLTDRLTDIQPYTYILTYCVIFFSITLRFSCVSKNATSLNNFIENWFNVVIHAGDNQGFYTHYLQLWVS